ncbi:unnamed protein product [Allacma fusca]|uniref:Uncharacterized protein n=1 Tax=Allacma fusca TaxID=39272 RepID=A0A8J2JJ12_9HEXA|nr:unnamed protein product [Allacma fusca]
MFLSILSRVLRNLRSGSPSESFSEQYVRRESNSQGIMAMAEYGKWVFAMVIMLSIAVTVIVVLDNHVKDFDDRINYRGAYVNNTHNAG